MATERTAYCWPVDEECEWWAIQTPDFSEKFKDSIKSTIPSTDRDWNNVDKHWVVRQNWKVWTLNLLVRCFPGCDIEEGG